VAAGDGLVPDWRDAAAYEPLLEADRSLIAWEWLRRDPAYRVAAERASREACRRGSASEAPAQWGLHAFEPPRLAAPEARPVWRAELHPFVLAVEASPSSGEDIFDLALLGEASTLVTAADGREHLLISDGFRTIRIDVLAGSVARGSVELRYRLTGLARTERPLLTLRRLLALCRTGRFCRSLHPSETRAKRWLLMLRTRDALASGADQREIAAALLSPDARQRRWRTESSSLRSRAQRLVRSARAMEAGGFWALLSGAGG
jgi:hypothetical protein